MKNPWQTLDIQLVYQNPWIQVTHRNVLNPAGKPGIYGVVHFQNIAIAIVPIDEEGNTWLVGQYRYTIDTYSWEIPEGGGAKDASPLESAKRELLEETGLTARTWLEAGTLHMSNSVTDEVGLIFIAKDLSEGVPAPEETEDLRIKKVPLEEAVQMVLNGQITDAFSIAALLKVKMLIDRKMV